MTNNLRERLKQHKENIEFGNKTFASKYNLEFLVYYEKFTWVQEAIGREKELKKWRREKKEREKDTSPSQLTSGLRGVNSSSLS